MDALRLYRLLRGDITTSEEDQESAVRKAFAEGQHSPVSMPNQSQSSGGSGAESNTLLGASQHLSHPASSGTPAQSSSTNRHKHKEKLGKKDHRKDYKQEKKKRGRSSASQSGSKSDKEKSHDRRTSSSKKGDQDNATSDTTTESNKAGEGDTFADLAASRPVNTARVDDDGAIGDRTTDTAFTANEEEPTGSSDFAEAVQDAASVRAEADQTSAFPEGNEQRTHEDAPTAEGDTAPAEESAPLLAGAPAGVPADASADAPVYAPKRRGRPSKKALAEREAARRAAEAASPAQAVVSPSNETAGASPQKQKGNADRADDDDDDDETPLASHIQESHPSDTPTTKGQAKSKARASAKQQASDGDTSAVPRAKPGRPRKSTTASGRKSLQSQAGAEKQDAIGAVAGGPEASKAQSEAQRETTHPVAHPVMQGVKQDELVFNSVKVPGTVNFATVGGPTFSRLLEDIKSLELTKALVRDRLKLSKKAPLMLAYVHHGSVIDLADEDDFRAFQRKMYSTPAWASEDVVIHVKPPEGFKYQSVFQVPLTSAYTPLPAHVGVNAGDHSIQHEVRFEGQSPHTDQQSNVHILGEEPIAQSTSLGLKQSARKSNGQNGTGSDNVVESSQESPLSAQPQERPSPPTEERTHPNLAEDITMDQSILSGSGAAATTAAAAAPTPGKRKRRTAAEMAVARQAAAEAKEARAAARAARPSRGRGSKMDAASRVAQASRGTQQEQEGALPTEEEGGEGEEEEEEEEAAGVPSEPSHSAEAGTGVMDEAGIGEEADPPQPGESARKRARNSARQSGSGGTAGFDPILPESGSGDHPDTSVSVDVQGGGEPHTPQTPGQQRHPRKTLSCAVCHTQPHHPLAECALKDDVPLLESRLDQLVAQGRRKNMTERSAQKELAHLLGKKKYMK